MRRPELLEEPSRYTDVRVPGGGGGPLSVTLSATDGLLCTARLPATITDDELQRTAEMFGPVRFAFVLRSETSGEYSGERWEGCLNMAKRGGMLGLGIAEVFDEKTWRRTVTESTHFCWLIWE